MPAELPDHGDSRPLVSQSAQVPASSSKVTMSMKSAESEPGRATARRKVALQPFLKPMSS